MFLKSWGIGQTHEADREENARKIERKTAGVPTEHQIGKRIGHLFYKGGGNGGRVASERDFVRPGRGGGTGEEGLENSFKGAGKTMHTTTQGPMIVGVTNCKNRRKDFKKGHLVN